jgi:radical SAM-linked protein
VKAWERVLRRAEIPVEYSQGFIPHPRMQFAAALPVGVTSESEYLDVWLTRRLEGPFEDWIARMAASSPAGLAVYEIIDMPLKGPALPTLVTQAEYVFSPYEDVIDPQELKHRAERLLAETQIERTRNKKTYDLRPLILDLKVDDQGQLVAQMLSGEKSNGRPDELLAALGLELSDAQIHRRHLYLADAAQPSGT